MAAAAAVLVLAVVGAAVAGSWRLQPRSWLQLRDVGPVTPPSMPSMPDRFPTAQPQADQPALDLGWLVWVGLGLGVLAAAAVLWWLWRRYWGSDVRRAQAHAIGATVVLPATPEVPVLQQGVVAAQRYLDEIADPTDAIVAAWLALEAAASASGVVREPAETPTEFTVDVLAATSADPGATRDLLALYHRARFSAAGVTRADVLAAGTCLAVLAASWDGLSPQTVTDTVAATISGHDRAADPR